MSAFFSPRKLELVSLFFLSLSLFWIWGGFSPSGQTSIVTDHKEKLGVDKNLSGTPQIVVRVSNPLPPTREMWGPWESPRVQGGRGDPHHVKSPLYLKSGKKNLNLPRWRQWSAAWRGSRSWPRTPESPSLWASLPLPSALSPEPQGPGPPFSGLELRKVPHLPGTCSP